MKMMTNMLEVRNLEGTAMHHWGPWAIFSYTIKCYEEVDKKEWKRSADDLHCFVWYAYLYCKKTVAECLVKSW